MQSGILKYEQSTIHVNRMGQGSQLLFAFHDFGQNANVFNPLEKALGHKYTIIAFDIPGAGKSEWAQKTIDKRALVTIIERFKLEFKVEKFNILAMGLGALYALTLMEQRSEWIDKAIVFDPLGLRRSSWQQRATVHFLTKGKIDKAIENPTRKAKIIKGLVSWGWIKKDWVAELENYIEDKALAAAWMKVFPLHFVLVPEIQKVRWQVNKNKVELRFYISDDKFTLKKDAFKFAKKQTTVYVDFEPSQNMEDVNWVLQTAESILNPKQ